MGAFTDALRSFIETGLLASGWTSANPLVTNKVKNLDFNPIDFEALLEGSATTKNNPEVKAMKEKIARYQEGPVEQLNKFSSAQFGNIKAMASNPIGFLVAMFSRTLIKVISVIGIVAIIAEIVRFAIMEALKPGRMLDRRFKRLAQDEIQIFWDHQEQQKLRQGFRDVRSTNPGLRGGMGMVNGNLFAHQSGAGSLGPPTEYWRTTIVSSKNPYGYPSRPNGNPKWIGRGIP
ncbi:hypothetical protein IIB34_00640 [PVC group bacterium]|nr:hypothetical protein [PVC group bacterium]